MNGPTLRILVVGLAILLVLAAGMAMILALRNQPPPPSVVLNEAEENAANPYLGEMNCIDRVLQRNDMDVNQVQPALENCRASAGTENGSAGR